MASIPEIYTKGVTTKEILDIVHNQIIDRYNFAQKAEVDKVKALQMENILRSLKKYNRNHDDLVSQSMQEEVNQIIIEEATQLMNQARGGREIIKTRGNENEVSYSLNNFLPNSIFHRQHNVLSGYGADDIFEEELAAVLAVIESKGTNKSISIDSKLTGSVMANVNLENEILNSTTIDILQRLDKTFSKRKTKTKPQDFSRLQYRSQKVDVTGIEGNFTAKLDDVWKIMFETFKGVSFTVKNYSSIGKGGLPTEQLNIHLGSTNAFKSFYAILSSIGYDQNSIEKLFYRSFANRYIQTGHPGVLSHIYHIQFIYELTGIGLYSTDDVSLNGADFIVYNDPSSDNIYVQSTAELIQQELERTDISKYLKSINIAKSRF